MWKRHSLRPYSPLGVVPNQPVRHQGWCLASSHPPKLSWLICVTQVLPTISMSSLSSPHPPYQLHLILNGPWRQDELWSCLGEVAEVKDWEKKKNMKHQTIQDYFLRKPEHLRTLKEESMPVRPETLVTLKTIASRTVLVIKSHW
jgi:hypothetical protein